MKRSTATTFEVCSSTPPTLSTVLSILFLLRPQSLLGWRRGSLGLSKVEGLPKLMRPEHLPTASTGVHWVIAPLAAMELS